MRDTLRLMFKRIRITTRGECIEVKDLEHKTIYRIAFTAGGTPTASVNGTITPSQLLPVYVLRLAEQEHAGMVLAAKQKIIAQKLRDARDWDLSNEYHYRYGWI